MAERGRLLWVHVALAALAHSVVSSSGKVIRDTDQRAVEHISELSVGEWSRQNSVLHAKFETTLLTQRRKLAIPSCGGVDVAVIA